MNQNHVALGSGKEKGWTVQRPATAPAHSAFTTCHMLYKLLQQNGNESSVKHEGGQWSEGGGGDASPGQMLKCEMSTGKEGNEPLSYLVDY